MDNFFTNIVKLIRAEIRLASLRLDLTFKRVMIKIVFMLLSLPLFVYGLYMLLLSLFFSLSNLDYLVSPAILDGLASLVIAAIFIVISLKIPIKNE